jgi:hypothetical protein
MEWSESDIINLSSADPVSMSKYKSNKPSSFTQILERTKLLNGNWEVGVRWIRVPFTWRTIEKPTRFGILVKPNDSTQSRYTNRTAAKNTDDEFDRRLFSQKIEWYEENNSGYISYTFPPGFYQSRKEVGEKLAEGINARLQGSNVSVFFEELPHRTYRFVVTGGDVGLFAENAYILQDILGFKVGSALDGRLIGLQDIRHAKCDDKRFKPFAAYPDVDVYCNIIETYPYGTGRCNQIFALSQSGEKEGSMVYRHVGTPHYYPVAMKEISESR